MPDWCVMKFCNANAKANHVSLFSFPKDEDVKKKWISFVRRANPKWNSKTGHKQSTLCSLHFQADDFTNYQMFKMGLAHRLSLVKGAVPSVYPIPVLNMLKRAEAAEKASLSSSSLNIDCKVIYQVPQKALTADKGIQCKLVEMQSTRSTQTDTPSEGSQTNSVTSSTSTSPARKRRKNCRKGACS